jgi:hypothetical protein
MPYSLLEVPWPLLLVVAFEVLLSHLFRLFVTVVVGFFAICSKLFEAAFYVLTQYN